MAKPRVKKKKDGISTFIATLLLMVLAVSAGVVIYAYTMGYLGGVTVKTESGVLQVQSVAQFDGGLHIYAKNIGKGTVKIDPADGLARVYVNGVDVRDWDPPLTYSPNPPEVLEGVTSEIVITGFTDADVGKTSTIKIVSADGTFALTNVKITQDAVGGGGGPYTLTTHVAGTGLGSVTLDPSGGSYASGTVVTVTAIASSGSFTGWSGSLSGSTNPETLTMNGIKDVTATFTLGMASPTLSTTPPTGAVVGVGFTDSATLSGATSDAEGTVTYTLNSGTYPGTLVDSDTVTVTDGVVPNSKDFTVASAGNYYFLAVYSGDAKNNGDTSDAEPFTVGAAGSTTTTLLSQIVITLGESVTDEATVSVTTGPGATGTVDFEVSTDGVTWNKYGGTKTLSGGTATSDPYAPLAAGDFKFRAKYSGDSNYASSQSGNDDEPLTVNKATPTTATLLSDSSITLGESVTDTVTVTGLGVSYPAPTGDVEFYWSTDHTNWNKYDTVTLPTVLSDPYEPLSAVTHWFKAVYIGDVNYGGSESGEMAEELTVNPTGVQVTFKASGVSSDAGSNVVLRVDVGNDGWDYSYAYSELTGAGTSITVTPGTAVKYEYQSPVATSDSGKQYVWASTAGTGSFAPATAQTDTYTITQASEITGTYSTQFWITVTSIHDTPTASAWVTAGQSFATSVTSPDGTWICTGYAIDGGGPVAGTSYTFTDVQAKHTIVFNWVGSGSFGYTTKGSSTSGLDNIRGSRFTCTSAGTAVSISAYLRLQSLTGTFGNTGTSANGFSIKDVIRGQRFSTPAYSVVADSITARIYCSTASKLMKAAIYDTNGDLIAQTNELTVPTDTYSQLITFTFASPPTLSASTQYILVVWSQSGSGSADLRYDSNTGGNGRIAAQTYGSWPSSVSFTSDSYQYIVYCNYHYDITFQAKAAIYSADGSTFIASTEEKTLSTIDNWVTFNFVSSPTLAASTNYVLVVWSSDTSNVDIYRDTGTAERFERSVAYGSWPSYVTDQYSQRTYSIYCTYTIP